MNQLKHNLLAILCLFIFNHLFAINYYISPQGDDTNQGTLNQPWKSFNKADAMLQPGDTLFIRAGNYAEKIQPQNSGTEQAPIVYKAYPGDEMPRIGGVAGEWPTLLIENKQHIIVEGLFLKLLQMAEGSGNAFNIVVNGSETDYITIRNCDIKYTEDEAAYFHLFGYKEVGMQIRNGARHTLVEGCNFENVGLTGISIYNGQPDENWPAVKYTTIRGNTVSLDRHHTCIGVSSSFGQPHHTLIEGNIISKGQIGINIDGIWGLDSANQVNDFDNQAAIIRNNIVFDCEDKLIGLTGAKNIVVEKNILCCSKTGSGIGKSNNSGSKDIIIRKNIIYDNHSGMYAENSYWNIYNNIIINNNLSDDGETTYDGNGIYASNVDSGLTIVNNIVGDNWGGNIEIESNNIFEASNHTYTSNEGVNPFSDLPEHPDLENYHPLETERSDLFATQDNSLADAGVFLTTTTSAAQNSTQLQVFNADYFYDGYGRPFDCGDSIQMEGSTDVVKINSVDYENNILILEHPVSCESGQGVSLPYKGVAPAIGLEGIINLTTVDKFTMSNIKVYPNPFRSVTNITYSIENPGFVSFELYNIYGEKVKTLSNKNQQVSVCTLTWDGCNDQGNKVNPGIYLYRLVNSGEVMNVGKIMLSR